MNPESYKFASYYRTRRETRWADVGEIKNDASHIHLPDQQYPAAGLPVINTGRDAWVDDTDTHSLIFGATGSKKTRLFCMPMLNMMIGAGESFITTDPKGELYDRTSGLAKARGYEVVVLNYRDLNYGDTWNPLALPYEQYHNGQTDDAMARLNDFVNAISAENAEHVHDIFWVNAAKTLALSILLLMVDMLEPEECNLRTLTRFCSEFSKGSSEEEVMKAYGANVDALEENYLNQLFDLAPVDSIARTNYVGLAKSNDRARGDIQSQLYSMVQVFITQERLVRNMASSSFDIRKAGHKKMAVYLIVPDEKSTYHFIATTFIKQCYEILIEEAQKQQGRTLPVRVNFVLDEFANIPTIPDMPSMITAARSRNMRFYLVIQSMHQLRKRYKDEAQTIKGNCDNWVFLTSKEIELLQEISTLCGSIHTADGSNSWPLISTSQLQRLNKQRGEALIFHRRQYPFITEMADIDNCAFEKHPPVAMQKVKRDSFESVEPKQVYTQLGRGKRKKPFSRKYG